MKYFSYDPADGGWGFEFHNTAEKAQKRAEQILQHAYDDDCFDSVDEICWGEIKGQCAIKPYIEDGVDTGSIHYVLKQLEQEDG